MERQNEILSVKDKEITEFKTKQEISYAQNEALKVRTIIQKPYFVKCALSIIMYGDNGEIFNRIATLLVQLNLCLCGLFKNYIFVLL